MENEKRGYEGIRKIKQVSLKKHSKTVAFVKCETPKSVTVAKNKTQCSYSDFYTQAH